MGQGSVAAHAGEAAAEGRQAWIIVWATFVALAVIFGVAYSFAAFFESFASEFRARRADVSLVFGLSGLVYFVVGAGAGVLADRFGPARVCGAGMLMVAAGLVGTSFATSMGMVYLAYGIGIGIGIGLVYTPSIATVPPWFKARRGLAAGIASAGIGFGTLAIPLVATAAIGLLEWRGALRALAAGALLLGCSATLLLKRAPLPPSAAGDRLAGLTLREALATLRFRWLYVAVVLGGCVMFTPFAHVSAAARDLGIDDARSVGLVGLIGIGSLTGRFGIGALADRLGRLRTLALMQASMGLAYLAWGGAGGYAMLVFFALWFGVSYGGIVSLLPALCMDMFGARAVASILGILYTGAAVGNLLGPVIAGAVFDRFGSYQPVIAGCLGLAVLATAASARLMRLKGRSW